MDDQKLKLIQEMDANHERVDSLTKKVIYLAVILAIGLLATIMVLKPMMSNIERRDETQFELKLSEKFNQPKRFGSVIVFIKNSVRDYPKKHPTSYRIPVAIYDQRHYKLNGPLLNILPWIPAFVDENTQQSFFYLPDDQICIFPGLMNKHGDLLSVAELVANSYASFLRYSTNPMAPGNILESFIPEEQGVTIDDSPNFNRVNGGFDGAFHLELSTLPGVIGKKLKKDSKQIEYKSEEDAEKHHSEYEHQINRRSNPVESRYVSDKERAMVRVSATSVVGILFDEIPKGARHKARKLLRRKCISFWRALATQQLKYTQVKLIFRPYYYSNLEAGSKRGTLSLTLPRFFRIKFTSTPRFQTIDGHLLYLRSYTFENILITDTESLAESDDRLGVVGGTIVEKYTLPIDPFLILQRTGFACIGEFQWPPNSVDAETVEYFYDDQCNKEEPQHPNISGCQQCHCTHPLPEYSCVDAVKKHIGHVKMDLVFTRIPDNATLADEWRFPAEGPSMNNDGVVAPVNLYELEENMAKTRIIYQYIDKNGCELVEGCIERNGWRRLLTFSTTSINGGIKDFEAGRVVYFSDGTPTDYVTKYRMYEYSPCHKHYHFSYYVIFSFGELSQDLRKKGFCLQTTYRHFNTEWSVMAQNHYSCGNQGIAPGWSDTYQDGLTCQWVDVSSVNTKKRPYTGELRSFVNPEEMLCEGTVLNDTWVETNLTTQCCGGSGCCGDSNLTQCCGGLPVTRPGCDKWQGADDDNVARVTTTIPLDGEGQVTAKCSNSSGSWGEKRDCGFRLHPKGKMLSCDTPGSMVSLNGVISKKFYQVVRICEASLVLNSCLACNWNSSLVTTTVRVNDEPKDIQFKCTPQRDAEETGGKFCVYIAPLFEEQQHKPTYVDWGCLTSHN